MKTRVFSPSGRSSRIEYLPIFLIWLLGTLFVQLAGGDVRREFGLAVAYPVVSGVTALLAWLQICATMRRLQDLNWSWLLALPWMLAALWPICYLFELPGIFVFSVAFGGYALVTACLFLFLPARTATPRPVFTQPAAPAFSAPVEVSEPPVAPQAGVQPSPPPTISQEFLAGWLVVDSGANRGREYRLRARTTQPQGWAMDVSASDGGGSALDGVQLRFEPQQMRYGIASAQVTILRNGRAVPDNEPLAAYDRLRIGGETFIFIPLYGSYYRWPAANARAGVVTHA